MLFSVFKGKWGEELVGTAEIEPVCGEHFCDTCGDCLYCYGGDDSCYDSASHYAVWYLSKHSDEIDNPLPEGVTLEPRP